MTGKPAKDITPQDAHLIDQAEGWAVDVLNQLVGNQVEFYVARGTFPTSSLQTRQEAIEYLETLPVDNLRALVHCAVSQLAAVHVVSGQARGDYPDFRGDDDDE